MKGATFYYKFVAIPLLVISIHAPMKGATAIKTFCHKSQRLNFNPRAHEGRDLAGLNPNSYNDIFQSTRP